jgi:Flp pilus assembly pilin Flp
MKKIIDFLRDEEGAALPEYALLVALIAVVCIVAMQALGTGVNDNLLQGWYTY